MKTSKPAQIIILPFLLASLTSCSNLMRFLIDNHVFDGKVERFGIKKYSHSLSSLSICDRLTFRYYEYPKDSDPLVDNHIYDSAYFHFLSVDDGSLKYEKAFLRLDYNMSNYSFAYNYIYNQ